MPRKKHIDSLYYITHINNLASILKRGILSHAIVENENIDPTSVYDSQIVTNRRYRQTPNGKSLWEFANFYFQPRNPMLYRVLHENPDNGIIVLSIKSSILKLKGAFVTTGNAASDKSEILPASEHGNRDFMSKLRENIDIDWWKEEDGSKRKIMAECLVPESVPPDLIQAIYVPSQKAAKKIEQLINNKMPVIIEPKMFFLPKARIVITDNLSLIQGDMFFSRKQTLTISVNCVGVMGKGLASTAKYRFPDMYVYYQDLCKEGILKMGNPQLYKREGSIFTELAENTNNSSEDPQETWFLLFPTKQHWKNKADYNGIDQGLQWLQENYKREGIKSLAMPALGCGLGNLEWQDVGPLMCKYLSNLDIHVSIYLPTDRKVDDELLNQEFLLKNNCN